MRALRFTCADGRCPTYFEGDGLVIVRDATTRRRWYVYEIAYPDGESEPPKFVVRSMFTSREAAREYASDLHERSGR